MSRSEYEKRSCNIRHDHPSHLWIPRRGQGARCPGIGGSTGIVRVDTRDEALVERIARDVWEKNRLSDEGYGPWEEAEAWDKDWGRDSVRAVLAALREES